jgi:predicted acylesterase/phospholipase RssA
MPTQQPLGPIALSLSGGGYRAAGFHLGVLDMLDRLDLLKDLSALSTVSGGTFTGMRYALSQKAREPFRVFFEKFKNDLLSVDIVDLALAKLSKGAPAIPSGRWDVITACAQVYDEKFFGRQRFNVFWEAPAIPLTELIFNSTEFRTAVAFRFQKSENPLARIGNGTVSITADQARQLRLADIAAASSCFPGGFEPLSFPDDFDWPDTAEGAAALKEVQAEDWTPLPLMDGGVYDNQGMGSLILGLKSRLKDFGLFIFSDTNPEMHDLYQLPKPRPLGWLRLWHLKVFWWFLLILALLTVAVTARFAGVPWHPSRDFLHWLPLVLPFVTVVALVWLRRKIAVALCRVPQVEGSVWRFVKNLKVNQFIDMMELRISSLLALTSSVFMRRIRQLVYTSILGDEDFKGRTLPVSIYNLLGAKQRPPPLEWLTPTPAMQKVALAADTLPTTLWFTAPEQLRDLLATGQITICRKVLLQVLSLCENNPDKVPPHLLPLYERARTLWEKLGTDPYALAGPSEPALQ